MTQIVKASELFDLIKTAYGEPPKTILNETTDPGELVDEKDVKKAHKLLRGKRLKKINKPHDNSQDIVPTRVKMAMSDVDKLRRSHSKHNGTAYGAVNKSLKASASKARKDAPLSFRGKVVGNYNRLLTQTQNGHGAIISFSDKKSSMIGKMIRKFTGSRWHHTGILDMTDGIPHVIHNYEGRGVGGLVREPLRRYGRTSELKFMVPKGVTMIQRNKAVEVARDAATKGIKYPTKSALGGFMFDMSERVPQDRASLRSKLRNMANKLSGAYKEFGGVCSTLPADVYAKATGRQKNDMAGFLTNTKVDNLKYRWISPAELATSPNMNIVGHYKPKVFKKLPKKGITEFKLVRRRKR